MEKDIEQVVTKKQKQKKTINFFYGELVVFQMGNYFGQRRDVIGSEFDIVH